MTDSDETSWMLDAIGKYGNNTAIIENEKEITYFDLRRLIDHSRLKLETFGITAGSRVALIGDFSATSVSLIISLINMHAVIVPLTEVSARRQATLLEICAAEFVIDATQNRGISETVFSKWDLNDSNRANHEFFKILANRNHPGLILFTSGSTGEPKAVVHDFVALLSKFKKVGKPLKTLNFLLFDHWGGLNTLFHTLMSGGTVACPTQRSPDYICALIARYKLELLPASPSFLNLALVSGSFKRFDLSSLKLITYGAEPMPSSTLKRLRRELPNVELRQTYGLIELGVLRAKSENSDSLLVKIGGEGYEIRVANGLLEIKAESTMLGYLNAPSPFTDDGYFKTGDRVEIHGEYLRILGRESEQINVGGEKVFPNEIEEVLLDCELVLDSVVYGQKHPISGNIVCADIVLKNSSQDQPAARVLIRKHCNASLESFKVPVKIQFVEGPLTNSRQKRVRIGRGEHQND